MKKTKLISLCLSVMMLTPLLAGCGEKNKANGDSSKGEDVTISILFSDNTHSPFSKDWPVLKWIKEKTGVTLDPQVIPQSDYRTKKKMIFNSGNIPDIVTKQYPEGNDYFNGLLLPINKYEDKLPNMVKVLKDNGFYDLWKQQEVADGNIYLLPCGLHEELYASQQWLIRKDIFEKNNIPVPKTLDEVYEAGKKLKEIYPDSTPIINKFGSQNIMCGLGNAFDVNFGYAFGEGVKYDEKTKQYSFNPISQGFKDLVTYANKLYKDGVLDNEYTTLDSAVYDQKLTTGKTFIVYAWTQDMQRFIAEGKKIDPDFDLQVIYPPSGYKDTYAVRWAYPWLGSAVLPASLEEDPQHLEEVLKYINWCYSDEAEELLTFGKEGETFKVEDGVRKYIAPNIQAKYGVGHQSITFRQNMDYYTGAFDKDQRDLLSKISKECVKPGPPPSPLNADQLEQVQVYITTLRDYCTTMLEKFVSGAEPLSKWDDYVAQCKAKGCDKLVETYNNALKNKK